MRERGNINNPAALQGHVTIIGAVGNRPLWMGGLGLRSSKYPLLDVDTHTTDRHQSVHRLGCFISHKTKRCSLFSHCLPQPVRDPHLLRKHGRHSQGRNHPARDSSARPLCNFTRGLGKEVLNPRTYGQNVWTCCQEIWESAGRTPEECTCAHTCTYAHTHHPLFLLLLEGAVSPRWLKTTKEALVQLVFSKQEKGKKSERAFRSTTRKEIWGGGIRGEERTG